MLFEKKKFDMSFTILDNNDDANILSHTIHIHSLRLLTFQQCDKLEPPWMLFSKHIHYPIQINVCLAMRVKRASLVPCWL